MYICTSTEDQRLVNFSSQIILKSEIAIKDLGKILEALCFPGLV